MLNMACRIWHDIVFGLLNSAQHYAETSPVGGEAEQAASERERVRERRETQARQEAEEGEMEDKQPDEDWDGFRDG